jgi:exodeoxyribonuclease VII small subunit
MNLTFEEAQAELEQIVARLERGDVGVDELTTLWERGEELYRICAAKLESVRGKIEELARSTQTDQDTG